MTARRQQDSTSIAFALFAEKVEIEPSGRLTISGVVHGVQVDPHHGANGDAVPVQFGLCLGFLVGPDQPDYRLRIDIRDPEGGTATYLDGGEVRARQESGGGLLQILQRIEFTPGPLGLYWFQVYLDGEVRAQIPLRVSPRNTSHDTEAADRGGRQESHTS